MCECICVQVCMCDYVVEGVRQRIRTVFLQPGASSVLLQAMGKKEDKNGGKEEVKPK